MYMAHQAMLNQSLFDDQDFSSQLGLFSFPSNTLLTSTSTSIPYGCFQPTSSNSSLLVDDVHVQVPLPTPTLSQSPNLKYEQDDIFSHFGRPQILSLQRSTGNLWACGDVTDRMSLVKRNGMDSLNVISGIKMKKMRAAGRKNVREPRFCFKTLSDVDVLDDGYKWRKYGQKVVKNTQHPRSYYRCTQDKCKVKKRIERLAEDPRMVITTYEGRHVHSPSNDQDDSHSSSSHLTTFFC